MTVLSGTIARESFGPALMEDLRVTPAAPHDLDRYLDLLEELAEWLEGSGIRQWPRGQFRASAEYYRESIHQSEVFLAFSGADLVAAFRLLSSDPVVWPEAGGSDALYLYNLAVRRRWSGQGLGPRLLAWAEDRAAAAGRPFLRLDCFANSPRLSRYYEAAGFQNCGDVDAAYPPPIGTLRLRRFEKRAQASDRHRM